MGRVHRLHRARDGADGRSGRRHASRSDARGLPLDINCSSSWSPDGRHIVFAVQHEFDDYDGHELMVATLDDAPPRPIVIPELPPSAYSELYGLDWS